MSDTIIPDISCLDPLEEGVTFESVSRYCLIHRLGEGGMGDVWLAERLSAGSHSQLVAVKFLRSADAGEMLADEALRISRLSHDNIVPFIDSGRDSNGRFFVAMAYVQGLDLAELRKVAGMDVEAIYEQKAVNRLPDAIVGFIVFMVLRALNYAHTYRFDSSEVGLIHRDVSPGNILIDEVRGFVKLTDFGVAMRKSRSSIVGRIAGKVPYMAPEVMRGEIVDTRADLYSLGLVAYELITGFNPNISHSDFKSVLGAIASIMISLEEPLRPPDEVIEGVNPSLSKIISKLLAVSPDERYQSAEEALSELTHCLYSDGVGPTTDSLATYMKFLRNPESAELRETVRTMPFFKCGTADSDHYPKWILTKAAKESLEAGLNPGRG